MARPLRIGYEGAFIISQQEGMKGRQFIGFSLIMIHSNAP